ncbi:hypothetical protein [Bacillus cereus]|uniref:hypothetical protein n=1 Tax=Bacillus cereus TaxID=1396 RepID=UPI002AC1EA38|nr:hypothetical protein [Bacillus cereus]MDZ4567226.1 hypothetical protein [Bacillus cereus]
MKVTYKEIEFENRRGEKVCHYILNKEDNNRYIANCAALAFHKSLVGISELRALESVKDHSTAGGLRISRAVSTYYSIYHLFVAMMLLDKNFDIRLNPKKCKDGSIDFGVNEENLNNPEETPKAWKDASELEQDLATSITHGNIKFYCHELRKRKDKLTVPYKLLYNNFVKADNRDKSVAGLFEKVCYIRDRAVYRPSIVYSHGGKEIHTSQDIRKEIEGLPSSGYLLSRVKEIILGLNVKTKYGSLEEFVKKNDNLLVKSCFYHFSHAHFCEDEKYIKSLGYTAEDIEKFRYTDQEPLSFNTHITHLMELVDRERLRKDHDEIWADLL